MASKNPNPLNQLDHKTHSLTINKKLWDKPQIIPCTTKPSKVKRTKK
jgi:hypothetical protein